MKRINMHFDDESLSVLDKVIKEIDKAKKGVWHSKYTRSELVRYAIGKVFKIDFRRTHWGFDEKEVEAAIAKIAKEKKKNDQ